MSLSPGETVNFDHFAALLLSTEHFLKYSILIRAHAHRMKAGKLRILFVLVSLWEHEPDMAQFTTCMLTYCKVHVYVRDIQ